MSFYLYGVLESSQDRDFGAIGFERGEDGLGAVTALSFKDIAAVIGTAPRDDFSFLGKEELVRVLLAHQRTLEIVMKGEFILPFKFGTVLKDRDEVREVLSENYERLREWLWKMKDQCEINLVINWDSKEMAKEIAAQDPEILKCKEAFQTLPSERRQDEKISLGERLSVKLKARSDRLAQEMISILRGASLAVATHERMNDDMIVNASFLIRTRESERFLKVVEDLDCRFNGKFNFRCIGPLPPYSFAMMAVRPFEQDEIRRAAQVLELANGDGLERVKKAYKEKSRQCHPDIHPEMNPQGFWDLHSAYETLLDYYEGGCRPWRVSLMSVGEGLEGLTG